jgi:hypothetical protein
MSNQVQSEFITSIVNLRFASDLQIRTWLNFNVVWVLGPEIWVANLICFINFP